MKWICNILFIALIVACNSTSDGIASTDSAYKTVVPATPIINSENYVGTLPCADCESIDVSLQVNKDSSYVMNSVYKGSRIDSSSNSVKDIGTWSIKGDTLFLSTNNHSIMYIKTDTALIQLDGNGNRITGTSANMYILHKK
jgi:uncharacterized lipoprotein NlpE involved in copper resistance